MRHLHRRVIAFVLFFCAIKPSFAQQVTWTPEPLAAGSPSLFAIELPAATVAVTGRWQNHDLIFFRAPHTNTWYGLAGVDVEAKPGDYPLAVETTEADGTKQTINQSVGVRSAPYEEIPLNVPERFVEPNAAELRKIAADQALKNKAFAHTAAVPLWSGPFRPPLKVAPETDSFGTRRVFNGKLASVHRGLDYHARPRTPVFAVNSGRVVLARSLYYEGNCVIIDHGLGLMTLYMHLSRFNVKEGAKIRRGQIVALSGGTGRVTGPHLHLGVRWQGAYLDPVKLYALQLPTMR